MSKALLSWTEPKDAALVGSKSPLVRFLVNVLGIGLCVAALSQLVRGNGSAFFFMALSLLSLSISLGIVRPRICITEDGFRVKHLLISNLYHWSEVEWYQLFSALASEKIGGVHIKVRRGKRKQTEWLLLKYDRTRTDESALIAVLQSKLAGRCVT